ncbi:N-6 DNA methylase [Variovorax sp. RB3P1]|uniref:N-6 DNA methylase n=1 Tax=Variovorax sp. RB3P1 TaxID=3443732 RepID=UPI003F47F437
MTLSQQIQKLVHGSRDIRTPKAGLEAMFEAVFNTLPMAPYMQAFPHGYLRINPEFVTVTKHTAKDLAQLKVCADTYLDMVRSAEPFEDVLGGEYDQYLGFDWGQFFTPSDVAGLIGELNISTGNHEEAIASNQPISISDVCSGGGALTVGMLHKLYQVHGKPAIALVDIHAVDRDHHMCRLTSLQVILSSMVHQVPFSSLRVECGNPLIQDEKLFAYAIPNVRTYLNHHAMNELDRYEYEKQKCLQQKVA